MENKVLERGNIYFFYRPKVQPYRDEEPLIKSATEIQRSYILLHSSDSINNKHKDIYRLLLIGRKQLPDMSSMHEKNWILVDKVVKDKSKIVEYLNAEVYNTETRGKRLLPAARPAGEGVYAIVSHLQNTYLIYMLELPKRRGKVQRFMKIEKKASYVLSVKNPDRGLVMNRPQAQFPASIKKYFENKNFIPLISVKFLNYEGAELLLIGAKKSVKKSLKTKIKPESETINTADIFIDLKLWKEEHPISPLFSGEWV